MRIVRTHRDDAWFDLQEEIVGLTGIGEFITRGNGYVSGFIKFDANQEIPNFFPTLSTYFFAVQVEEINEEAS